jgi:hypothetical protein
MAVSCRFIVSQCHADTMHCSVLQIHCILVPCRNMAVSCRFIVSQCHTHTLQWQQIHCLAMQKHWSVAQMHCSAIQVFDINCIVNAVSCLAIAVQCSAVLCSAVLCSDVSRTQALLGFSLNYHNNYGIDLDWQLKTVTLSFSRTHKTWNWTQRNWSSISFSNCLW